MLDNLFQNYAEKLYDTYNKNNPLGNGDKTKTAQSGAQYFRDATKAFVVGLVAAIAGVAVAVFAGFATLPIVGIAVAATIFTASVALGVTFIKKAHEVLKPQKS